MGLSGTIPAELGTANMPVLSVLRLQRNSISGSIGTTLPELPIIEVCNFGHNQLSSSLPANIGDRWATLRGFRVHNNSLDGALPASLASLSSLEALDLRRNLLGELVLTDIQNMPALKRCDLRDNLFSCPVPA